MDTIKDKAQAFIKYREQKDMRCDLLLMMLSVTVGVDQETCERRINELAMEE